MNMEENRLKNLAERMYALETKLAKKNDALNHTRLKLARAKKNIHRLKNIVTYQRERIIQLHS